MIEYIVFIIIIFILIGLLIYVRINGNKRLYQEQSDLSSAYNKAINENKRLRQGYSELIDKDTLVNNYVSLKRKLKAWRRASKFVATFEDVGIDTIEDRLSEMFERAKKEIIIVSPYITPSAWNRVSRRFSDFIDCGGKIEVFTKCDEKDFSEGYSNKDVLEEVKELGGKVYCFSKLHAKIYLVDGREAIITSANFTGGGFDYNYESGIWTCSPSIIHEAEDFAEKLRRASSSF